MSSNHATMSVCVRGINKNRKKPLLVRVSAGWFYLSTTAVCSISFLSTAISLAVLLLYTPRMKVAVAHLLHVQSSRLLLWRRRCSTCRGQNK